MAAFGVAFGNIGSTGPGVLSPVAPQATEQTATTTTPATAPVTSLASPTFPQARHRVSRRLPSFTDSDQQAAFSVRFRFGPPPK